jgi:hypothetical protein
LDPVPQVGLNPRRRIQIIGWISDYPVANPVNPTTSMETILEFKIVPKIPVCIIFWKLRVLEFTNKYFVLRKLSNARPYLD